MVYIESVVKSPKVKPLRKETCYGLKRVMKRDTELSVLYIIIYKGRNQKKKFESDALISNSEFAVCISLRLGVRAGLGYEIQNPDILYIYIINPGIKYRKKDNWLPEFSW